MKVQPINSLKPQLILHTAILPLHFLHRSQIKVQFKKKQFLILDGKWICTISAMTIFGIKLPQLQSHFDNFGIIGNGESHDEGTEKLECCLNGLCSLFLMPVSLKITFYGNLVKGTEKCLMWCMFSPKPRDSHNVMFYSPCCMCRQ